MTIEEKAKAYDEAVNKLRRFMARGVEPLITRADVQDFFPELKESKDEMIRKMCMRYLDREYQHCSFADDKKNIEKCIAWLEKQGKSMWRDEDEKNLNDLDVILFEYRDMSKENYWHIINWLKSLKQRME